MVRRAPARKKLQVEMQSAANVYVNKGEGVVKTILSLLVA